MDLLALHLLLGNREESKWGGRPYFLPVSRPAPEESEQSEHPSLALRVLFLHFWLWRARNFWAVHLVTRVSPPLGEIGAAAFESLGATLLPIIHLAALAAFWWSALFPFGICLPT